MVITIGGCGKTVYGLLVWRLPYIADAGDSVLLVGLSPYAMNTGVGYNFYRLVVYVGKAAAQDIGLSERRILTGLLLLKSSRS